MSGYWIVLFTDGTKELICEPCYSKEHAGPGKAIYWGAVSQWASVSRLTEPVRCDACRTLLKSEQAATA